MALSSFRALLTELLMLRENNRMVVKDRTLLVGGHGRGITDPRNGSVVTSNNPKWVKMIDGDFKVKHVDWSSKYERLAIAAGVTFPGYLMHEAVLWSDMRREWVFLPRRRSVEAFNKSENEKRGWNVALIAGEDFEHIAAVEIQDLLDPSGHRGFSSAKFVPGTDDHIIAAVRTVEIDDSRDKGARRKTESYFSVFDVSSGAILMDERAFSDKKFEGFVFL